ncbi:trypsin-like serine peptidase [Bacillus thuringiensis]|uniref:trypsin-like serine peptidase n=1 Tax=Bacillus thuringiensis TaxID=1428 RepID=UPI000BF76114|nr:serine protease [Bacillus thuringiensis]PFA82536.1 hypothetical protein CN400_20935 [Bacillus thuringiensis]
MKIQGLLNDRDLMDELGKYLSTSDLMDYAESRAQGNLSPELEAIIMKVGRPSLLIQNNSFELPESETWKERLKNSQAILKKIIPSVGRIELKEHPSYDWVGTGWMIDNNIIITNRHVAQVFISEDENLSFKINHRGKFMSADIDFREEYKQPEQLEFSIIKALYIEKEPGPDIAFFQVSPTTNMGDAQLPEPIQLSNKILDKEHYVAAIGYPAFDSRNDPIVMKEIFQDIYDTKRISPGLLHPPASGEWLVTHDCSTLGGSSGSVLVDIETGEALGLHFGGKYLGTNYAVSSVKIIETLQKIK